MLSFTELMFFQTEDNRWEMAKRRITQETFDAAVRENMEEFEMAAGEALQEAVEQFESQGTGNIRRGGRAQPRLYGQLLLTLTLQHVITRSDRHQHRFLLFFTLTCKNKNID